MEDKVTSWATRGWFPAGVEVFLFATALRPAPHQRDTGVSVPSVTSTAHFYLVSRLRRRRPQLYSRNSDYAQANKLSPFLRGLLEHPNTFTLRCRLGIHCPAIRCSVTGYEVSTHSTGLGKSETNCPVMQGYTQKRGYLRFCTECCSVPDTNRYVEELYTIHCIYSALQQLIQCR